jgi:mRNA-degrading endonuclease RelE of RelBE toxin-antitoxin system
MAGITYGIQLHLDARRDLADLFKSDPKAAGQILAFLEEVQGDEDLLEAFSDHEFEDDRITVKMVVQMQRERWNGWRVTLRDVEPPERILPYRILYAFDAKRRVYHVLGIKPRGIAYDDATLDRACEICKSLGIDPLPR